jgi:hypothetical protein
MQAMSMCTVMTIDPEENIAGLIIVDVRKDTVSSDPLCTRLLTNALMVV